MKVFLDPGAYLPERAHEWDAGLDLRSRKRKIILPWGHATFDTGVHLQLPHGTVGTVDNKSGLNVHHNLVCGGSGVIDENYRGSITVKLYNLSILPYFVKKGEKVAQLIIHPCLHENIELGELDVDADRGSSGFGSSGRL